MSEDTDHIDLKACKRRNIRVVKMDKISIDHLSNLSIAILLMSTVNWVDANRNVNSILQSKNLVESIREDSNYCMELSNRTAGIIGLGSLGLSVGNKMKTLGISSLLYNDIDEATGAKDIGAEYVSLDDLFQKSDIIFVCANMKFDGESSTVFQKDVFSKMKSTAILIDATKGLHADFTDLYEALRSGEIGAVGLDIREYDVIPNRHPLTVLENCHFLPYRECYKWDLRRKLSGELAQDILKSLEPELKNLPYVLEL